MSTTKKATKKAGRRASNGATKTQLEQRVRDVEAEADLAARERDEANAEAERLQAEIDQLRAGPGAGPDVDELPMVRAVEDAGYDLDRYRQMCRRRFPAASIGVQSRSYCRACSQLRGKNACKEHNWLGRGQCRWTYDAVDGPVRCPGDHTSAAAHFTFVGHAPLTNFLIEIDPGYQVEFLGHAPNGNPEPILTERQLGLWMRLTICGISHVDIGLADRGADNAYQKAYGTALRRAAMRHGIGLEFWSKETLEEFGPDGEPDEDPAEAEQAGPAPAEQGGNDPLASPEQLAALNDMIGTIQSPKDRAAVRKHIRERIKVNPGLQKLTVDEFERALAYATVVAGELAAAQTAVQPPGDAAADPSPDHPSEGQERQGGPEDPQRTDSEPAGTAEPTSQDCVDRLLRFESGKAKKLKAFLEECELWPIADHPDEAGPIWEAMDEVEAQP